MPLGREPQNQMPPPVLISGSRLMAFEKQLRDRHSESVRQLGDVVERNVPQPALDAAYISPVKVGFLRQPFLRPAAFSPQFTDPVGERVDCQICDFLMLRPQDLIVQPCTLKVYRRKVTIQHVR
jgi:hypothetical protein